MIFNYVGQFDLKICDFGLSQVGESKVDYVKGTDMFIDPQIIQKGLVTFKSDMWSLGSLILQFFFNGDRLKFLRKSSLKCEPMKSERQVETLLSERLIEPCIADVIRKCLVVSSSRRASARDIIELLASNGTHMQPPVTSQVPPFVLKIKQVRGKFRAFQTQTHCHLFLAESERFFSFDIRQRVLQADQFGEKDAEAIRALKCQLGVQGEFELKKRQAVRFSEFKKEQDAVSFQVAFDSFDCEYRFKKQVSGYQLEAAFVSLQSLPGPAAKVGFLDNNFLTVEPISFKKSAL